MHRYHKIHIRCGDTIFLKIYRIRYLQHTYLNISLQIYKSKLRTYFLDIAKMKIKIIYHCLHKSLLHIFYKYRSSINVICFLKSSITRTIFIFWFIKGHCFYVSVLYMLLYLICNYIRFSYLFFKRLNWILGRYVLVKYPRVLDTYQIYIHEANESMMFQ